MSGPAPKHDYLVRISQDGKLVGFAGSPGTGLVRVRGSGHRFTRIDAQEFAVQLTLRPESIRCGAAAAPVRAGR